MNTCIFILEDKCLCNSHTYVPVRAIPCRQLRRVLDVV